MKELIHILKEGFGILMVVAYFPVAVGILISLFRGTHTENPRYMSFIDGLRFKIRNGEEMQKNDYYYSIVVCLALGFFWWEWFFLLAGFFILAAIVETLIWDKVRRLYP